MDLKAMPDHVLVRRLGELAAEGRRNLRAFVEHLREFEDRGLAAKTRHATTFVYCTQELRLTEGQAYRSMQVAGLIDRFPRVLDLIESGALSLATASTPAPHLNKSNFEEMTAKASRLPRREVEFLVASLAPKRQPVDVVRVMKEPAQPAVGITGIPAPQPTQTPSRPELEAHLGCERVEPLSGNVARIHFTASRSLLDKIERARSLLRHKYPFGEYQDIFEEALEALLVRRDPDRREAAASKREVLPDRRRIPQWIKDEVWRRDSGRCAFLAADGSRCAETSWLEFDHVQPFALGGRSDDPLNIRLLCRAHNQEAAKQAFGPYR